MMKLRNTVVLILCLCLFLCLAPLAFAEDGSENVVSKVYDKSVIVGFDTADYSSTVDTDHKYAMIELEKEFPAQLTVYFGGTVWYQADENGVNTVLRTEHEVEQRLDVAWKCLEDYNDALDAFHFVPELSGYPMANVVELPVITVNILGDIEVPELNMLPPAPFASVPILGSSTPGFLMSRQMSESHIPDFDSLPPLRNQNPYSTCWAFATLGAMEMDMIHDGLADTGIDLSELHLAYYVFHDFDDEKGCNDGDTVNLNGVNYLDVGLNSYLASIRLSSMIGPVDESEAPYDLAASYENPDKRIPGRSGGLQLAAMYSINALDTDSVKNAILDHGAVSASYYALTSSTNIYLDSVHNAYYCPDIKSQNHAIMLVGWDDTFPRSYFRTEPQHDGAWLVRNSWGAKNQWDYTGYFWISYDDVSLNYVNNTPNTFYAFDVQGTRYNHCYNYANGLGNGTMTSGHSSMDVSQSFEVDGGEDISAVGLYIQTANTSVDISVSDGSRSVKTTGLHFAFPGYYLVPLEESLPVAEESSVTLTVSLNAGSTKIPYSVEYGSTQTVTLNNQRYSIVFGCSTGSGGVTYSPGPHYDYDGRYLLFTNDDIPVSETLFPDEGFRAYVSSQRIDTDGSGYLSKAEIEAVTEIDLAGSADKPGSITDLSGIQTFSELETLKVSYNMIETLDLSQNAKLRRLECDGNALEALDLHENSALAALHCSGNALTTLTLGTSEAVNDNLKTLWCDHNRLSALDLTNTPALTKLYCDHNPLKALDLNNACQALNALVTGSKGADGHYLDTTTGNELVCDPQLLLLTAPLTGEGLTIDAERFPDAAFLARIKANCDVNADKILCPAEIAAVKWLDLSGEEIASLKGMEVFTALEVLDCSGNQLTRLDIGSNGALRKLSCQQNPLKALNISFNPNLLKLTGGEPTKADGVLTWSDGTSLLCINASVTLVTPTMTPDFVLPSALTRIEEDAFAGIQNLITVYIPNTVTYIDPNAFGEIGELYILGQDGSSAKSFAVDRGYTFIPLA